MDMIKSERTVNISVPTDILHDAKKMQQITASVLSKLQCGGCHSGFDLRFRDLREFVVNPQTLDVNELHTF
jgi:hypothetical protein